MEEQESEELRARFRRERLHEYRGRQFLRKTFAAYPSLRSIDEVAWDEQGGFHLSEPYTGQEYDPEEFEVIEGGWDHEHCCVCWARIEPGGEYWEDMENHLVKLCLECHRQLTAGPA